MDGGTLLLVIGVALWLGSMVMTGLIPFKPGVLRITRFAVCPPGVELQVRKYVHSYHYPGQGALDVFYLDRNQQRHDVKIRALLVFWGMCSFPALPVAYGVILALRQLAG